MITMIMYYDDHDGHISFFQTYLHCKIKEIHVNLCMLHVGTMYTCA